MEGIMSKHTHHQAFGVIKSEDIHREVAVNGSSLQLIAYQIHQEKGGDALDNWLEAERILKNEEIKERSKGG
jgi:uncharacterized protein YqgQ